MEELLKGLAQALVENPDAVTVNRVEKDHSIVLELHVAESDMGRVIGKQGRIAKAIRTVMKAATAKESKRVSVEIM